MSVAVVYEGRCCSDCLMMLASGETGDRDETIAHDRKMDAWRDRLPKGNMVAACDGSDCDEFSWTRCQACGSNLGGAHHGFVILQEVQS